MSSTLKVIIMQEVLNIDNLKTAREKAGLTKAQAARKLKLSNIGYCRYEYGERNPNIQILEAIAGCFNTSVEYLLGKTKDMSPDSVTVKKDESPELFDLIEVVKNSDADRIKRLTAYYTMMTEGKERT